MTTHIVQDKINQFVSAKDAISRDPELSAEGKTRRLAKLQAEIEAYRPQAMHDLGYAWDLTRHTWKLLDIKRRLLESEAGKRWDYNRLIFYRGSVERAIRDCQSMDDLRSLYSRARDSGDLHQARAWAEFGQDAAAAKFGTPAAASVVNLMRHDLERLTTPDGWDELVKDGAENTQTALRLKEATEAAAKFYDDNTGLYPSQFGQLMQNVNLTYRVDPENLAESWSLIIEEGKNDNNPT